MKKHKLAKLFFTVYLLPVCSLIVLNQDEKLYIDSLIQRLQTSPQDQLFGNSIYPPCDTAFPVVLIYSPLLRSQSTLDCPEHNVHFTLSHWTNENAVGSSRNPRLIYGKSFNVVLVQQYYTCKFGHSILSTNPYVLDCDSLKPYNHFPFQKYHRTIFSYELIEYIFSSVVNGVSFSQIHESIATCQASHFMQNANINDKDLTKLLAKDYSATPSKDSIESTFLDIYQRCKKHYRKTLVIPKEAISVDHTFKVGKSIGGYRDIDNKYINEYMKLFIVLNEEGLIVDWSLTKTVSQVEIEPLLEQIKNRMESKTLTYIYSDTCCNAKSVFEKIFPTTSVKLDLFHACQRVCKTLTNKRSPNARKFANDFGLIFRKEGDIGEVRHFETPNEADLLCNLKSFLDSHQDYLQSLPPVKQQNTLFEIDNLKKHIKNGCLSGIVPGGGTENNERIHRYLNRSFLRGASVIGFELAEAVLSVLFFVYNSRLLNSKKKSKLPYVLVPFSTLRKNMIEKCEETQKDIDKTQKSLQENMDKNILTQISMEIVNIYNSLLVVNSQCVKRGFKPESILGFNNQKCNSGDENITQLSKNLISFGLKIDSVPKDGDCLFTSILLQTSKSNNAELQSHLKTLGFTNQKDESILLLRTLCVEELKTNPHYQHFLVSTDSQDIEKFLRRGFFASTVGDLMPQLCADVLHVPIVIIMSRRDMDISIIFPKKLKFKADPIYLAYHSEYSGHYDGTAPADTLQNVLNAKQCRCSCHSQQSCIQTEKSKCPCVLRGQLCNFACICRRCSNKNKETSVDPNKEHNCRCGSKLKKDGYIACTNIEGKRATKCPCFKQNQACTAKCLCRGCGNPHGSTQQQPSSEIGKKRAKRRDTKYKKMRNSMNKQDDFSDGPWTLLEIVVLYYSLDQSSKLSESVDVTNVTKIYNMIAKDSGLVGSDIKVRSKSHRSVMSKLEHLKKL